MIAVMSPLVAAVLGAFIGALLGAGVLVAVLRRPDRTPPRPSVNTDEVRSILGVLRAGVAVVGSQDEVVAANDAAERTGLVRGTRLAVPAVLDAAREARRTGDLVTLNVELTGRLGASAALLAVRVLPLDGGRLFVVADDREPLLRAHESTRDFVTNATHELKTPIGAISLLAEAVESAADDPDAVVRFAGRMRTESARLTDLVQQIITLSKLQGHPGMASAERLCIDDIVDQALDRTRSLAQAREVSLTVSGDRNLWVFGDADQLVTALANLIQNAINYSHERARVVVTTRAAPADDHVEIAVSDNGIGIAAEDTARIFERFYRVDYARSRASGGTGLGLSIVAEVADGHGGSINVWSKPGAGSTFTLRLPATRPDDEGEAA